MSNGIYVGMTAASAQSQRLELVSDNLANVDTPGFKKQTATFEAFVDDKNAASDKVLTRVRGTGVDMAPGIIESTGAPLDVVPTEGAYMGVLQGDGSVGYTRAGRLAVGSDGVLRAANLPVLTKGGSPILIPPGQTPQISPAGDVRVGNNILGTLAQFNLTSRDVNRVGTQVVVPRDEQAVEPANAAFQVGAIERSNASAVDSAVELVRVQRQFNHAMQAVETYRKLDDSAVEVGRVR